MKINFSLNYFTTPKEDVKLVLKDKQNRIITLEKGLGGQCCAEVEFMPSAESVIYYYAVYENEREKRREYPFPPRKINLAALPAGYTLTFKDAWRDFPPLSHLYTSAFTKDCAVRADLPVYDKTFIIKAYAPQLNERQELKICGSPESLGAWNTQKALPMRKTALNEWSVSLNAETLPEFSEFKFIAVSQDKTVWQQGKNNFLRANLQSKEMLVLSNFYPIFDAPQTRAAGVVLPVFSLRSEESFGVGDFGDLKKLVDWAAATGQKVIQILPINDTTITGSWTDSYPYNSISIYAFHPMYMNLKALGPLWDESKEDWFAKEQKRLNSYPKVNYEEVNLIKRAYIQMAFEEQHREVFQSEEYKKFFEDNKSWLKPYAVFRYLRNKFNTPDFRLWPDYRAYERQKIDELASPKSHAFRDIALYYYTQYNLHRQLLDATDYARSKGIIIKGDIPIGISPESVEAWTEPHYFNMGSQAGAPPDDFSVNGQNWGFPTYNWEEMAKDNYSWWKKRFKKMAEYFDAYRIDHVLGFFRIWDIPQSSVHGLLGQFSPALPMNKIEIKTFGLNFKEEFLLPRIDEALLKETFGQRAEEVKNIYLKPLSSGFYAFKEEYNTQRKIQKTFRGGTDKESIALREGLYSLLSNVLFVEDKTEKDRFHPRISALNSAAFKALGEKEKHAYANLYNHYFYHRHNDFWQRKALEKLPSLVSSARMLPCAEDLGMIPACVPYVLNTLQILSLEIQRMPKNPCERFAATENYPYRSVCTISTHDMSTLRGWWRENKNQTQDFYNQTLHREGPAPENASGEICEQVIRQHLNSPSMLCLLSFQDWLSMSEELRAEDIDGERINIPANPKHYWQYRMHLSIEDLIRNGALNAKIKNMIKENGR